MIKKILACITLCSFFTFSPVTTYAANKGLVEDYLAKWQDIFKLEKQIIDNLTFKENSHFPFSGGPYGNAKSITLVDNLQNKWVFTIHPFKTTPYIIESVSQVLRIADIRTNAVYAHTLNINGRNYIGSLEKQYKTKFLRTIKDMLTQEKSTILSQEAVTYLFESETILNYDQKGQFIVQPTNKIYYYPRDSKQPAESAFKDIFQYDENIFDKAFLKALQEKSFSFRKQTINPDNTGTPETFFKVSFLKGFSRDHSKRIHKYCARNAITAWDKKIGKTIDLLNSIPDKDFETLITPNEIGGSKIYKSYVKSVMERKNKINKFFHNFYKDADPENRYAKEVSYSKDDIKQMIDALKVKEKELKKELDTAEDKTSAQQAITSSVYPEAWMVTFCQRIKVLDKAQANAAMKKLMESTKNPEQKQTAKIYLKSIGPVKKPEATK